MPSSMEAVLSSARDDGSTFAANLLKLPSLLLVPRDKNENDARAGFDAFGVRGNSMPCWLRSSVSIFFGVLFSMEALLLSARDNGGTFAADLLELPSLVLVPGDANENDDRARLGGFGVRGNSMAEVVCASLLELLLLLLEILRLDFFLSDV